MNDILDGELGEFQEVLNSNDDLIEPLEEPSNLGNTNDVVAPNANLTVGGRTFDVLSGYMDYSISVRIHFSYF